MADPFAKVQPGEPLKIHAAAWNKMLDTVRQPHGLAAAFSGVEQASNVALIRNDSGIAVPACGVLGISGVTRDPEDGEFAGTNQQSGFVREFVRRPILTGVAPQIMTHGERFVVALEPIAVGAVGRAAVGGMFACKVLVTNIQHGFATIRNGSVASLQSARCGPVQLLWINQHGWAVGVR